MKAVTFETLVHDQIDRIERNKLKEGDNLILNYINNVNEELTQSVTLLSAENGSKTNV